MLILFLALSIANASLTYSEFENILQQHDYAVILFYQLNCERCQDFLPIYGSFKFNYTKEHPDLDIHIDDVDISKETQFIEKFNIEQDQLPILMMFHDDLQNKYEGPLQLEYVQKYVENRLRPISKYIETNEIDEYLLQGQQEVVMLYYANNNQTQGFKLYMNSTYDFDEIQFAHTFYDSTDKLVVQKPFDEKRQEFLLVTDEAKLREFIYDTSIPTYSKFDELKMNLLFHKGDPTVILFMNESHYDLHKIFSEIAPLYKDNDVRFAFVQEDDEIYDQMKSEIFQFYNLPFIALLNKQNDQFLKYKFEHQEISSKTLKQFVDDYLNEKLDPYFKSEPEDSDEVFEKSIVKKVTGSNFEKMVINSDMNVVLLFYAPWCSHCAKFKPIYEQAAEKLKKQANLIFAQVDDTQNEIQEDMVVGYPTVLFYKQQSKFSPILYSGTREESDLIQFVEQNLEKKDKEEL